MPFELQDIQANVPLRWVLPCPRGTESVLTDELHGMAIEDTRITATAVHASASLREGYRMAIGSRVASRLLLPLVRWTGPGDEPLYEALRRVPWWEHFDAGSTFAIGHSQEARLSSPGHYWVQRSKDAIVDAFREHSGDRPSVDKKDPQIRFHLHIEAEGGSFALDFSGSGHRRGYRHAPGSAPLKENLAAAILYLAGWPAAAKAGLPLVDPTCGSGTFLIEAALMATETAPGLLRKSFGFEHWRLHHPLLFEEERGRAVAHRRQNSPAPIFGYDASATALSFACENLKQAALSHVVGLREARIEQIERPAERGVLVCNPPYGHRLGDDSTLFLFYQSLGDTLKRNFGGWNAFIFAANNQNLKHVGLRPTKRHLLYNGSIECRLLEIPIREGSKADSPAWRKPSPEAQMFANRIKKNRKKWERWAGRQGIECYRLYDEDIPEYKVAVDRYANQVLVHVRARSRDGLSELEQRRIQDVLLVLPEQLGVGREDVIVKARHRHGEGDQYLRLSDEGEERMVREGDLRFWVNLHDRIDTGLFLDHRKVRARAFAQSRGKRTLNLFAYTCSVSLAAAVGGATETTSVDLSNTYLDWGRRNFELNDLSPGQHRFFRADAVRWMSKARGSYDWIFINPPTFSRSKKTKGDFNIHQHHGRLLEDAMARLSRGGELLFTTHAREFRLSEKLRERFVVREEGGALVPEDFVRTPFRAFSLRHRS